MLQKEASMARRDLPAFDDDPDKDDEDTTDTCNMCGGSGYLDTAETQLCPNCKGTGLT